MASPHRSELYQRLDTVHLAATGHSEGGLATTDMSSALRIRSLQQAQTAFDASNDVLVMMGDKLGATTRSSWIGSIKKPRMIAVPDRMRAELMADTASDRVLRTELHAVRGDAAFR